MSETTTAPKVFISYSWKPVANREKVLDLAHRLQGDGIHVILDVWDLKEGQDKNVFMEQLVNNPEVTRVLLICNKEYTEKANSRVGGVGIESLIVSDSIYASADQTKFVPVVFEKDDNGKPFVPTFVNSRIFIDLSEDEAFESEYENLMRNIFDKPASKRPPLGIPPVYITEKETLFLPTANKVSVLKAALVAEKKNAMLYVDDYFQAFLAALDTYSIPLEELKTPDVSPVVLKSIHEMTLLREDFIRFLDTWCKNTIDIDMQRLLTFFEKLANYVVNLEGSGNPNTLGSVRTDNYRFFFGDLFLHTITLMLTKERFTEVGEILSHVFIIEVTRYSDIQETDFTVFNNYIYTLNEYHKKKFDPQRVNVTGDTIKREAKGLLSFDDIHQTDIFLFYRSLLKGVFNHAWFPNTACYEFVPISFMRRAVSKRFFDKIKVLFNVSTKEELVKDIDYVQANNLDRLDRWNYELPQMARGLNIEKLCSLQ